MSGIVDKAALLNHAFGIEKFKIPNLGTVEIRPLVVAEALAVQTAELATDARIRRIVSLSMHNPKLTEDEVEHWFAHAPVLDVEPFIERCLHLAGMKPDTAKEAVKTFRHEPGT